MDASCLVVLNSSAIQNRPRATVPAFVASRSDAAVSAVRSIGSYSIGVSFPQPSASQAVVGLFDPGHDRQPGILAVEPMTKLTRPRPVLTRPLSRCSRWSANNGTRECRWKLLSPASFHSRSAMVRPVRSGVRTEKMTPATGPMMPSARANGTVPARVSANKGKTPAPSPRPT